MPYWIYIGNLSTPLNTGDAQDINKDEIAENAKEIIGTTYNYTVLLPTEVSGDPLVNGLFQVNNTVLTYAIDQGDEQKSVYSCHIRVDVEVKLTDNSTVELHAVIFQTGNGDLFIRPYYEDVDNWNSVISDTGIKSITVQSLDEGDDFTGSVASATAGFSAVIYEDGSFGPCFVAGTMIMTPTGEVAIETLAVGDLVMTNDHGPQPIRWIGSKKLDFSKNDDVRKMLPIRIRAGALGKNIPKADLLVSPQHRIFVRSRIAEKVCGNAEVLIPAKQMLIIDGIDIVNDMQSVEYFHILFDRHEVVISNGAKTESLFTGPVALSSLQEESRKEIFEIFPELCDYNYKRSEVRTFPSGRKARKIIMRHVQNQKPVCSTNI